MFNKLHIVVICKMQAWFAFKLFSKNELIHSKPINSKFISPNTSFISTIRKQIKDFKSNQLLESITDTKTWINNFLKIYSLQSVVLKVQTGNL